MNGIQSLNSVRFASGGMAFSKFNNTIKEEPGLMYRFIDKYVQPLLPATFKDDNLIPNRDAFELSKDTFEPSADSINNAYNRADVLDLFVPTGKTQKA